METGPIKRQYSYFRKVSISRYVLRRHINCRLLQKIIADFLSYDLLQHMV